MLSSMVEKLTKLTVLKNQPNYEKQYWELSPEKLHALDQFEKYLLFM